MIEVVETSLIMSVQDGGRWGFQRYGVSTSGPMDWFAHHAANALVKNAPGSAVIEMGMSSTALTIQTSCLVAVTGVGYRVQLNGFAQPLWTVFACQAGDQLRLVKQAGGNWVYLAVAGGFDLPHIMGSASTYAPAGLGRMLQVGDMLHLAGRIQNAHSLLGRYLAPDKQPNYGNAVEVRAVSGLHHERFIPEGLHSFWNTPYTITPNSDRMAYRLRGEVISHIANADIISQGMVSGAVQVPADGQPIVMQADHPTTGGYTQVAVVCTADLPLVAQCEPGMGRVKFRQVTLENAQQALSDAVRKIETGINDDLEDWMLL